jgi:hypothetical protein
MARLALQSRRRHRQPFVYISLFFYPFKIPKNQLFVVDRLQFLGISGGFLTLALWQRNQAFVDQVAFRPPRFFASELGDIFGDAGNNPDVGLLHVEI